VFDSVGTEAEVSNVSFPLSINVQFRATRIARLNANSKFAVDGFEGE